MKKNTLTVDPITLVNCECDNVKNHHQNAKLGFFENRTRIAETEFSAFSNFEVSSVRFVFLENLFSLGSAYG